MHWLLSLVNIEQNVWPSRILRNETQQLFAKLRLPWGFPPAPENPGLVSEPVEVNLSVHRTVRPSLRPLHHRPRTQSRRPLTHLWDRLAPTGCVRQIEMMPDGLIPRWNPQLVYAWVCVCVCVHMRRARVLDKARMNMFMMKKFPKRWNYVTGDSFRLKINK